MAEGIAKKSVDASSKRVKAPQRLLCVAIDFGTTYSGYAFSFKDTPNEISCETWRGMGGKGLTSQKTPTTVLLNADQELEEFGYKAEERYSEVIDDDDDECGNWYYFKQFKMELHSEKHPISIDSELTEKGGKQLPALEVFSKSIGFLTQRVLQRIEKVGKLVEPREITWVLTVPAIWDERAKQFMRTAAEEAGIPSDQLILALEPEAASVCVTTINVKRDEDADGQLILSPYDPGTKFMVVDLGGGTIDITIREVMEDRTLKELYVATGNALGGNSVNDEIYQFITELVGKDVMKKFNEPSNISAAYDLEKEIESKKRMTETQCNSGNIQIELPPVLLDLYKTNTGRDFSECPPLKSLANTVNLKRANKLHITPDLFVNFFKKSGESMMNAIRDILALDVTSGLKDVILVGGFADSFVIRNTIKRLFPDLNFIIPDEAGLSVLKGAVIYGHNPDIISARVSRYTFGTEVHRFFLDGDDESKKTLVDGKPFCKGVFNRLAEIGETFRIGQKVETYVYPLKADMTKMTVRCYTSTDKDPKYVEGCTYIGKMVVDMPNTDGGLERCVVVSLTFGDTELKIEGKDLSTGEAACVTLNTLS